MPIFLVVYVKFFYVFEFVGIDDIIVCVAIDFFCFNDEFLALLAFLVRDLVTGLDDDFVGDNELFVLFVLVSFVAFVEGRELLGCADDFNRIFGVFVTFFCWLLFVFD